MGILGDLEESANSALDGIFGGKKPTMKITTLPEGVDVQESAFQAKSEEAAYYQAMYLKLKQEIERAKQAGEVATVSDLLDELKKDAQNRRTMTEKQRTVTYREIWDYISTGNLIAYSKEGIPLGILKDVKKIYDEESGKTHHEAVWVDGDGNKHKAVAGSEEALFHNYEQLPLHLQAGVVHLNVVITKGGIVIPDYFKVEKLTMKKKDLDQIIYDMQVQLGKERDEKQELRFRSEQTELRAKNQALEIIHLKDMLSQQNINVSDLHSTLLEHAQRDSAQTRENVSLRETKDQLEQQLLANQDIVTGLTKELINAKDKTATTAALSEIRQLADLGKEMARKVVIKDEPDDKARRIEVVPQQEMQPQE